MNITNWLTDAKRILEKEEISHLSVHKGKIQLQLRNDFNGEIEIHEFNYTAKNAQNLKIEA